MCRLSWNLGASASWNPQGRSRRVHGLFYNTTAVLAPKDGHLDRNMMRDNNIQLTFTISMHSAGHVGIPINYDSVRVDLEKNGRYLCRRFTQRSKSWMKERFRPAQRVLRPRLKTHRCRNVFKICLGLLTLL